MIKRMPFAACALACVLAAPVLAGTAIFDKCFNNKFEEVLESGR